MERGQLDQVIDEKTLQAMAQDGNIRDYLKELEGSDYLVIGKLTRFILTLKKEKVPYLDEVVKSYIGIAEGNLRIDDSHTGRIIATEEVKIKKKYRKLTLEEVHSRLIDAYATKAAAGIVERLYPKRILAVLSDGTIFINRGADAGIKTGYTFTVERPGKELIDKDTGISFGFAETTIGTLQVTSVESARSRAKMLSGGAPIEGDILRNEAQPVKPKPEPKMKAPW